MINTQDRDDGFGECTCMQPSKTVSVVIVVFLTGVLGMFEGSIITVYSLVTGGNFENYPSNNLFFSERDLLVTNFNFTHNLETN